MKILLNAEAFGFGPSAAVSAIFDIIKTHFKNYTLDYIGQGHTLDLQSKLPYNKVLTYTNKEDFKNIVKDYDFFITALDFEKAKYAKEVGVKTIVYDTLLWYWQDKNIITYADYYITQDFYGVTNIVNSMNLQQHNVTSYVIPPLIQKKDVNKKCEDFLLINFGGLENPYWDISVTSSYIRKVLTSLLPIVKTRFKKIKIVCSQNHIAYLQDFPVETASYSEMQNLLQTASFVIATSGLGNIYELANYQVKSLFLPPVNDSQGQQLKILENEGLIDNNIDWSQFQTKINYFKSQIEVLKHIENNITHFNSDMFCQVVNEKLTLSGNLQLHTLFDNFGYNGKIVLENILQDILK